jgi:alpha-glucoside transport system substrate-binding protein
VVAVGATLLSLAALAAACTDPSPGRGGPPLGGDAEVEVLAVWEGGEAASFTRVLERFEDLSGASARYTSTAGVDLAEVLDARLASGDVPEVAIVPLPAIIERYARSGDLVPLDGIVAAELLDDVGRTWQELATVDGSVFGVWFKAAHKSLVWYRIDALERSGLVPPAELDGLVSLAGALSAAGTPAFAVGAADAWTLTDWFENLYLRIAGPERYDDLAERRLPWTDETVVRSLELLGTLLAPEHLAGGPAGALATTFPASVDTVFGPSRGAAMVAGGDFIAGFIADGTGSELGVDADVFLFPELPGAGRRVVGGGDAVVLLRRSPAADELVRFLASAEAGETWAALGGFLSPNEQVSLSSYPDDRTRSIARSLLDAGDGFRFDLSDQQPVELGGTAGAGMLAILPWFLDNPDRAEEAAARLEAAAAAAHGR